MEASLIEELGLAEAVVELWNSGKGHKEIAVELVRRGHEVSPDQVRYFLRKYALEGVAEGEAGSGGCMLQVRSIFDVEGIMQDVLAGLVDLHNSSSSDALRLRALREIRETAEAFVRVQKVVFDAQHVMKFQQDVLEVLAEVDPALRRKVLERMRQRRALALAGSEKL